MCVGVCACFRPALNVETVSEAPHSMVQAVFSEHIG